MKTKIARLTLTEIEVEIPDICPHCKADLHAEAAMRACGYMAVDQTCSLDADGGMDWEDNVRDFYETQHETGFECTNCDNMIVGTDGVSEA